eukprot:1162048-Rhodomonas_salina.1
MRVPTRVLVNRRVVEDAQHAEPCPSRCDSHGAVLNGNSYRARRKLLTCILSGNTTPSASTVPRAHSSNELLLVTPPSSGILGELLLEVGHVDGLLQHHPKSPEVSAELDTDYTRVTHSAQSDAERAHERAMDSACLDSGKRERESEQASEREGHLDRGDGLCGARGALLDKERGQACHHDGPAHTAGDARDESNMIVVVVGRSVLVGRSDVVVGVLDVGVGLGRRDRLDTRHSRERSQVQGRCYRLLKDHHHAHLRGGRAEVSLELAAAAVACLAVHGNRHRRDLDRVERRRRRGEVVLKGLHQRCLLTHAPTPHHPPASRIPLHGPRHHAPFKVEAGRGRRGGSAPGG